MFLAVATLLHLLAQNGAGTGARGSDDLTLGVLFDGERAKPSENISSHIITYNVPLWQGNITVRLLCVVAYWKHPFRIFRKVEDLLREDAQILFVDGAIPPRAVLDSIRDPLRIVTLHSPGNAFYNPGNPLLPARDSAVGPAGLCRPSGTAGSEWAKTSQDLGFTIETQTLEFSASQLKTFKWNFIIIIYDSNTDDSVKILSDYLSGARIKILTFHFGSSTKNKAIFQEILQVFEKMNRQLIYLCVVCGEVCIREILRQANCVEGTAMTLLSRWLVLAPPSLFSAIEQLGANLNNVAVVALSDRTHLMLEAITEKIRSTVSGTVGDLGLLEGRNQTWTDVKSLVGTSILNDIANCTLDGRIFTLMWKDPKRKLEAVVKENGKSGFLEKQVFPNTKYGFNKRMFVVTTNPWPPFVIKKIANHSVKYSGFCMDLLEALSSSLNFSYQIVEPDDGEWGRVLNGTWTGMIGQLQKKKVDMMIAPISIQAEREMVMDFILPYYYDYTVVLMKKHNATGKKWRTLIDPLHWQVLLCIGLSLPIMSFVLFVIEKYNPFYIDSQVHSGGRMESFFDSLQYMYGALLSEGGTILPASNAGRTLVSFWWLFTIAIAAIYSGNLIASFTVIKDKMPFTTLAEMIQQKEYKWGTTDGTYLIYLLQTSNRTEYQNIWKGIQEFSYEDADILNPDHTIHIKKVLQGSYAYINDRSSMEIVMFNHCDLALAKEEFLPLQYAIGLHNNSPYNKLFSEQMMSIYESGLLQSWKQRWWPHRDLCHDLTADAREITLQDIQSVFYLLAIGIIISLFILLMENGIKQQK